MNLHATAATLHKYLISTLLCLSLRVAAEPIWIDVRSPAEYLQGHLDGAINIPYHEVAVRIASITPNHAAEINVYCAVGVRAQIAKVQLESTGYKNVRNRGGYADLRAQRAAMRVAH